MTKGNKIALVQDGSYFYIGKVTGKYGNSLKLEALVEELHIPSRTFPPELVIKVWDIPEDYEAKGVLIKSILETHDKFRLAGKKYNQSLDALNKQFREEIREMVKSIKGYEVVK